MGEGAVGTAASAEPDGAGAGALGLHATGAGGAVLGSPVTSLVWLANTVGPLGISLEPGHIILPGSQTAAFAVQGGDVVRAQFGGIGKTQLGRRPDNGGRVLMEQPVITVQRASVPVAELAPL